MADTEIGAALLATARDALDRAFGGEGLAACRMAALDEPGATFVTLTQDGELRGCIGTLQAHRALKVDVAENTLAAAFSDPRFSPLVEAELVSTRIEVSLLSLPAPIAYAGEHDLLQRLAPGVDGVVLEWHGRRATFLPQVWESLPDPQQFMTALKRKAGIAADFRHDDVRVSRYTVTKWKERDTHELPVKS